MSKQFPFSLKWQETQQGALVSEVKTGGWAAVGQLSVGDLIIAIDAAPVTDVETLEREMKKVADGKPKAVTFRVVRDIQTVYVELEPKWDNNA